MASPFYLFRKYQKTFLVIAGVLAMFIFVVADPLMSWLQSSGGGGGQRSAKTVLASWDGGSINAQELDNLTRRRYKLHEFLVTLYQSAAGTIQQEGGTPPEPSVQSLLLAPNSNTQQVRQSCITTRVLASLAEESGITVSDDFINHYLKEWGLRKMGNAEIGALLNRVGMREKTLFAGLRELLLGKFYIDSFGSVTMGVMPEQRWQDWKRINERIAIEAAILPTDKFLADVPEPSEAELQQFYEQYKERVEGIPEFVMGVNLPSPDPGFREPRRVRLQFLLGDVNEWTQKYLDEVTDEEIADYYERNKRTQFEKSASDSLFEDEDDDAESDEISYTEETADDAESDKEAESETDESAADTTATEAAEETVPPAEEAQPADTDSGLQKANSPFRLTSLPVEEEEEEEEEEESAEETEAAADAAEVSAEEEEATDEETPQDNEEEEAVEYVPLEEVKDQIRRQLATEKAVVELKKVVDKTYTRLQSAFNPYGSAVVLAESEGKEVPAPPAKLADYAETAKETGLAHELTTLLSDRELAETFVGKARDAQTRREFVTHKAFRDLELYEPYLAQDLDGNWYLLCKTEDVASSVPSLDDVRDRVVSAWKTREAAKLALAKAEEFAKLAQESGDTVAAVCSGKGFQVITTDMFSWLTFGTTPAEMQRGPRLGEAPPLESVGADFMTKTFELEPDQKIALQNYDQSQTYVVQLAKRQQTKEEMKQQFLNEANTWYGGRVMRQIRANNSQRQLIFQITDKVGLNLENYQKYFSEE